MTHKPFKQSFVFSLQYCDTLYVRSGDRGCRLATLQSVTKSAISTYCSHDFESLPRMGLKPFRLAISGHLDGSVQVWDLTKALEQAWFEVINLHRDILKFYVFLRVFFCGIFLCAGKRRFYA